uniref:Ycf1 n=1 Tax=Crepidomanes latealatum TaxID=164669 RepID=UPI0023D83D19|nr:Ycf1 [Crepidomanes latealatum]WDE75917.1 Ycf1 [Crepidomanes latealatum]
MNVASVQVSLYLFQASLITWIRVASPCILFGLYYGLLSTLPIGPSHIISIRSFLLRGNASGFAALSGLMIGQLILSLSIFCSPLYMLIIKPHIITLLILPYLLFYWFRIKDLLDYRTFHPIGLLSDSHISRIFIETLILQILNPILLPSPVLARLIHLFLFRYSNNGIFLISTFLGWLSGHILFLNLCKLLVIRLENDSPILYLLIKRVIHNTFSIIIYMIVLLYLGKAPVSLFTHSVENRLVLLEEEFCQLPNWMVWIFKEWPTSCFDQTRPNRPIRYVPCWFNGNNPVRKQVSTLFFDKCLSDGKERITFTALPSLSIFGNQLQLLEPLKEKQSDLNPYKYWIDNQSRKKEALISELRDRTRSLDTKCIFSETRESRTELTSENEEEPPKPCNPYLSNLDRIKFPISISSWIFYDFFKKSPLIKTKNEYIEQDEYDSQLEDWIYYKYEQLGFDKIPLPWEPIPPKAQDTFFFMFEDSEDVRVQKLLEEIDNLCKENDLSSIWDWEITWELVSQLPMPERTLFFICLHEDSSGFDWVNLFDISSTDNEEESFYSKQELRSIYKIEEALIELAEEYEVIIDNPFDIVGGVTDIRNRKFKNLGISIEKTTSKPKRIIKRYSEAPDFRRELIKGSMRSRRRKMLVWNLFQEKGHSPFFLRLMEIPNRSQRSLPRLIDSKALTIDSEQETNQEFEKQLSSSSSKNIQIMRSLVSSRLDVGSIHTGRSLLLVLQSNLRKYVKLPLLITFKNLARIFLFQAPEWDEDWSECHKESHINCTYDGEEFSDTDLPARWLKEGLQIKIVHPFQLKPWHDHKKKTIIKGNKIRSQRSRRGNSEKEIFRATYLTIWGSQTDRPFGNIQKEPPFWKPIKRELIKTWKGNISLQTREIETFLSRLGIPMKSDSIIRKDLNPLKRVGVTQEDHNQTNSIRSILLSETKEKQERNSQKIDSESIHIANDFQSINDVKDKKLLDTLVGFDSKIGVPVYQPKKIDTDERTIGSFHLNKEEIKRRLNNKNLNSSLIFKKLLIDIRRRILMFRLGIVKSIDKYLLAAKYLQRANRILSRYSVPFITFPIQLVQILKDTIQNHVNREELALAIPNTSQNMFQIDNKSIRPLSQAYIYDNLWCANGTDNVDLNDLLKTLKDNEILKELENQEELNKYYNLLNDCKHNCKGESDSKEYNHFVQNDDLSIKRTKSSISLYDKKSNRKKQDFLECLDNRNKIIQQYIDEPIKEFVMIQGLSKQLSDLIADDWKNWLESFNRYNLPLEVWRKIAPQEWRVNAENLNRFEDIQRDPFERQEKYVSHKEPDDFCFYKENPLFRDRIKNLNKRHKNAHLLSNLVNSIQRHGSEILKNDGKQKNWWKNRIKDVILKNNQKIFYQQIDNFEKELVSKIDLALWIIPDDINNEDLSKTELRSPFEPKTCILKEICMESFIGKELDSKKEEDDSNITTNEILLRDRLNNYFLSQWEWKSEESKRFQKFKDLLSLTNILPDIHDITESISMDPELANIFFYEEDIDFEALEDLFFCSSHHFSRVFDDQLLMYKLVSILLRFKNRSRKRLDTNIFDECKRRLFFIDETTDSSYLYNIDDLLLPRRRRESQILGSIGIEIPKHGESKEGYILDYPFRVQKTGKGEESEDSSKTQMVKRFLWPSHRLEELACINRFYLNTNNGSRFAILKIRMYTVL